MNDIWICYFYYDLQIKVFSLHSLDTWLREKHFFELWSLKSLWLPYQGRVSLSFVPIACCICQLSVRDGLIKIVLILCVQLPMSNWNAEVSKSAEGSRGSTKQEKTLVCAMEWDCYDSSGVFFLYMSTSIWKYTLKSVYMSVHYHIHGFKQSRNTTSFSPLSLLFPFGRYLLIFATFYPPSISSFLHYHQGNPCCEYKTPVYRTRSAVRGDMN